MYMPRKQYAVCPYCGKLPVTEDHDYFAMTRCPDGCLSVVGADGKQSGELWDKCAAAAWPMLESNHAR